MNPRQFTVELQQDDNPQLGEFLEDEMSKVLKEEIDREVMISLLEDIGWTKVVLKTMPTFEDTELISAWLKGNCRDRYTEYPYNTYLFREKKDAELFILKWA